MKRKLKSSRFIFVAVTALFLVGYIVYPLLQLLVIARPAVETLDGLEGKQLFTACINSILLSIASVAGSAIIGIYLAYSFHFKKIWLKKTLAAIILLLMAIPPITGVMSYLFLLGDNGLLMKLLGLKSFVFTGWSAILTIHLYSFYPLFYLFIGNALKAMDSSLLEASQVLGGGKVKTFYHIVLPQLRPALLGASLLTFMASMASFSAPFIFGNFNRFLTTEIYYAKINGDTSLSALLSLLLAILSLGMLHLFRLYSKSIPSAGQTKGTARKTEPIAYRKVSPVTTLIVLFFCGMILLPVITLFFVSLAPENCMMRNDLCFSFSFHNYSALFAGNDLLESFFNSLKASALAVSFTVLLGLSVAHIIRKKQMFGKGVFEAISSVPYGIPGTVIAICLILSFNQPSFLTFNNILVGSFWILPVAYTVRNLPIITQAAKSGLQAIDPSFEEASANLGANGFRTWRFVTLPLIFPFVAEGALLVFINSFGEFVATILLYNPSSKTLPIEIYSQMRLYNNGMAATYGVLLFLIVISIIFFTKKIIHKKSIA